MKTSLPTVFSSMMGDFMNSEKANMHLIYGAANGNGKAVLQLYQESFPNRHRLNPKMFE